MREQERRQLIRRLETARLRTAEAEYLCVLCSAPIRLGMFYADARGGDLAHYRCVPGLGRAREPWQVAEVNYSLPVNAVGDERAGLRRFFDEDAEG